MNPCATSPSVDTELRDAYEDAFAEWAGSEDAALWDQASADGLAS